MRNIYSNPPYSADSSKGLIKDIQTALNSDRGFDQDSDVGLDIMQKFQEVTRNPKVSTQGIVIQMLKACSQSLNELCDKHEAKLDDVHQETLN